MVSFVSDASSIAFGSFGSRGGRDMTNVPFRLVPAADVLEDEDVAVVGQVLEVAAEVPLGPAIDAVGRADEDDRQRPFRLLGDVDSVWSFTPSRIGTMASVRSNSTSACSCATRFVGARGERRRGR